MLGGLAVRHISAESEVKQLERGAQRRGPSGGDKPMVWKLEQANSATISGLDLNKLTLIDYVSDRRVRFAVQCVIISID
jgi:hypothetical protein